MVSLTRTRLLTSTLLLTGAVFVVPAHAQEAGAEESQTVVVTGSRIARPDIETAAPIASVGTEEIGLQAGSANIENVLNDMPQINATTTANSNNPGGGVATVNLRLLGPARTLVLVDGKRYVSFSVTQQVDLNTIPSALVERVDVITGGQSAVYGSDAIAGAVNFIMKKDFRVSSCSPAMTLPSAATARSGTSAARSAPTSTMAAAMWSRMSATSTAPARLPAAAISAVSR